MTHTQFYKAKKHRHQYFVNTEGEMVCGACQKEHGSKKAAPHTYTVKGTFYDGYWYDSGFEANQAMELDWKLKAGKIAGWDRQFGIEIRNPKTGELLRKHKVDFRVKLNDGSFELIEVKGYETEAYRYIRTEIEVLWLPEHLDYKYIVFK